MYIYSCTLYNSEVLYDYINKTDLTTLHEYFHFKLLHTTTPLHFGSQQWTVYSTRFIWVSYLYIQNINQLLNYDLLFSIKLPGSIKATISGTFTGCNIRDAYTSMHIHFTLHYIQSLIMI